VEEDDDSFDFSALDDAEELLSEDEPSGESASADSDESIEFEEDFGVDDEELQQSSGDAEGIDFELSEAEPDTQASGKT